MVTITQLHPVTALARGVDCMGIRDTHSVTVDIERKGKAYRCHVTRYIDTRARLSSADRIQFAVQIFGNGKEVRETALLDAREVVLALGKAEIAKAQREAANDEIAQPGNVVEREALDDEPAQQAANDKIARKAERVATWEALGERAKAYYNAIARGACTFVAYDSAGDVVGLFALARFDRRTWRFTLTSAKRAAGDNGRVEWWAADLRRLDVATFNLARNEGN